MTRRLAATIVAAAFLTIGLTGCETDEPADKYAGMSCYDLTTEMLKMTGVDATQEYDLDKVWEIQDARDERGCKPTAPRPPVTPAAPV